MCQYTFSLWKTVIDETLRHFIGHHAKEDFIANFGMPDWLADHNVDTWAHSDIEDERERAAWQLFEKVDNDKFVNYLRWLAYDRNWFGARAKALVEDMLRDQP